ncbi:MAG: hypothetical protein ACREDR_12780, partial [Blastocatellia bacterium]
MDGLLQNYASSPATAEPGVVLLSVPTAGHEFEDGERGGGKKHSLRWEPVIQGFHEVADGIEAITARHPLSKEASGVGVSFSARLVVPGIRGYPEEQWIATLTGDRAVFENQPRNAWPRLLIEFTVKPVLVDVSMQGFL